MSTVIRVENLGKKYVLRHQAASRSRYVALRDVLAHRFKEFWRRNSNGANPEREEFWALRNVSFDIQQGQAVGIIGRNGAGKSTLLKLLSRITEPTEGRIELEGRVASLLEVGTGFHPELTGRENIYLNGAVLGMQRAEIKRKFDEIVAFAEVEKFLDTPVKHFSSGMYMRLAFAVAAHLEPEILIVDEVLAVGDAEFQKKCLGKMQDVNKGGRTVLFVSHNMEAVMRLCNSCVVLRQGRLESSGKPAEQIKLYLNRNPSESGSENLALRPRPHGWLRLNAKVVAARAAGNSNGHWAFEFGSPMEFLAEVEVARPLEQAEITWAVFTQGGFEVASAWSGATVPGVKLGVGRHTVGILINSLFLVPGSYRLNLGLVSSGGHEDWVEHAAQFDIIPNPRSASHRADSIQAACIPAASYRFQ